MVASATSATLPKLRAGMKTPLNGWKQPTRIMLFGWDTSPWTRCLIATAPICVFRPFSSA